jgi:hypothetical protein
MRSVNKFYERIELRKSPCARRWCRFLPLVAGACFAFSCAVWAQTSNSPDGEANKSWTATTDVSAGSANPTRRFESHTQNGDRTVDVRSLQARGADGNFHPYQDIETETVRVNATTTQTTTRTFVRDSNGAKTLFQITAEEKHTLPGGDSKVVRTTSNPDANGNPQIVQREIQETHKISANVEETKTTVMLPNIEGGLAPAMQTQERQKRSGDTVEIQKTTLLSDGTGKWQVGETRQTTVKDDGKNHSREERVSRPDGEGQLNEITHTVGKESEDSSGAKRDSEETYSVDVPGAGRDGGLHLVQRVTTIQRSDAGKQQTTKVVEKPNPGDPDAGLQATTVEIDTVRAGASGAQATRTIQMRDANGDLGVVSVDLTKSNNPQAVEVQIAPAKPAPAKPK